jgi:hypothetical protein
LREGSGVVAAENRHLKKRIEDISDEHLLHVHHAVEERTGGVIRLTLSLPPPYEGCERYFRMCVGGVGSLPTLFGRAPAVVGVKVPSAELVKRKGRGVKGEA